MMALNISYLSAAMNSDNYQIWQDALSVGGGDDQVSSNYSLRDTLGEFAVGNSSSTNYGAKIGFREIELLSDVQTLSLSLGATSLDLGELANDSAATGAISLAVETNSSTGVSVTYSGSTLTCSGCSGTNTISGVGSSSVSSIAGSSQFGFNAIYSSGSSPIATATSNYDSASQFAFSTGDEIISSVGSINETTFSLNFIANISGGEVAGTYTTAIVYTATASF